MDSISIGQALLGAGLLTTLIILISGARGPLASVPGPWYSKYTSLVAKYYWFRGQKALYVQSLHKKYGPVVRVDPGEVYFASVNGHKTIHRFRKPFLKSAFYDVLAGNKDFVGSMFDTRDRDYHSKHRTILSGPMSKTSLKTVEPIVNARVELAVQKMVDEIKDRGCVDIMKWWMYMATDVIGELTFGDSFRMLEIGKPTQYILDVMAVPALAGLRILFGPIVNLAAQLPFKLPIFKAAADSESRLFRFSQEALQLHKRMVEADPTNAKPTLFKKIFEEGQQDLSQEEIEAEARSYIIGGSDTTSTTLTYLVWRVCREPAIKKKLVDALSTLPDGYKDDDLEQLPYLNQVIRETLRYYTATPGALPRETPPEGAEIDGHFIPGGVQINTQALSMHRLPNVYINPEKFDPSRWENPTKEMEEAWMPFGGGPRTCLGLNLAWMEMRLAVARFFRQFPNAKVSSREGFSNEDMRPLEYLLMFPRGKRCLIEAS